MRIGDIARQTGLRTSAVRFYEAERLLPPAARVSGRRVYGPETVTRLRLIAGAQRAGFTIREIRALLATLDAGTGLSAAMHAGAHRKLEDLDRAQAEIRAARRLLRDVLACGCDRLDECAIVTRAGSNRPYGSDGRTDRRRAPRRGRSRRT